MEEFKLHHFSVIELLDEEDFVTEQEIYNIQDGEITQLSLHLENLVSSSDPTQYKMTFNHLKHLEKGLLSVCSDIPTSPFDDNVCLLQQFEEQLLEYKGELVGICRNLLFLEIEDTSELSQLLARVEKQLLDGTLEIQK